MKRIMSAISAMLIAVCSIGNSFAHAESETKITPSGIAYSDIENSINDFISEREKGLASCEVSVFDADGVIYNGYYGKSNIRNNIDADELTVYEWASCSKLLVWTSVMQQWERGNLDLEADIREYLPENFLTKLQYPDEKITMINLMNHNAGFQESFYEDQQAAPDEVYDTLEEAVKTCECYQSYHVGEYTAYSNWSTALAAYIVEQTSGEDYVSYVHENIFEPLGMEHTCIDPKMRDNAWVKEKRQELNCYSITTETSDDFGTSMYGVQLFPAGAAIGTLEDFSKFGQAFVSEDCPLFENNSTRDEMFKPTSYYGDSDIAKNCHGLWTSENKVQLLGHAGNSSCSSNLVFDKESGLGAVIMTNEESETAFNYGIPTLLFGSITDREEYRNAYSDDTDISGYYYSKRGITNGAGKAMSITGGFMLWFKNDDGTYSMKLLGIPLDDSVLVPIGENQFVMQNNGMEMFMYIEDGKLEMMSVDYMKNNAGIVGTVSSYGFILFGIICILTLMIKLIAFIIRRTRKSGRKYTVAEKQILLQQVIYGVSGIIFRWLTIVIGAVNPTFTAVSGILAMLLGIISVANGGCLCYNTTKSNVRTRTKIKQYIWVILCMAYAVFIVAMQLYCFWKL